MYIYWTYCLRVSCTIPNIVISKLIIGFNNASNIKLINDIMVTII